MLKKRKRLVPLTTEQPKQTEFSLGFKYVGVAVKLRIGSYISMRSSRYEAHRKFGEHERCIRVARGVAESNSSFLSALQTS